MQTRKKTTGLVWFTNNLRVDDNTLLALACKEHESVLAVYCFDPNHFAETVYGFKKTERYRAQFLIETVQELSTNLAQKNITLLTYVQHPEIVISEICQTYAITDLYYQKEWTSEEQETISKVKETVPSAVTFHEEYDQFLIHPNEVLTLFNTIPEVFTQFRKKVEKYASISKPICISALAKENYRTQTTAIPKLKDLGYTAFEKHVNSAFPFKGGEQQALHRIQQYFFETKKLSYYKNTRNGLVGTDYSSKFSPWLANGSVSARTIYAAVKAYETSIEKNESTYWLIFELFWRDYFKYISLKHQNNIFKISGILHKDYSWSTDPKKIESWIEGTTANDFVNANMLELKHTGWMSNRGRQNVASYFAKELHLDWRIGAAYFEAMLLDYDVHSNYGNWLYVSGVGNDPRDRKFNVELQAERNDANHRFRTLWLQPKLF